MAKIERVEVMMVDLKPKTVRSDAIQSFVSQETPIVRITDSDGCVGTGYAYTIGTGGHSIIALLKNTLAPRLIGKEAEAIEAIWRELFFVTHATTVGAISSLALATIDTALWDLRCRRAKQPLHIMAGGAKTKIPLYNTECGWLHIEKSQLVEEALEAKENGFRASKVKLGSAHISEDRARLIAVRDAVGDDFEIMTDANQGFNASEAIRRARVLEEVGCAWFEEPIHGDDVGQHVQLARSTSVPIAVGESLYSISQFKEYFAMGGASIAQIDVARIGGITPFLKVAHMAEAFNIPVCPHFLMELHLGLVCAIPNSVWLEYIPQLDLITNDTMRMEDGYAFPSEEAGLGINWNWEVINKMRVEGCTLEFSK
ncbi:mandelate racemase/muconate lactonizing enzyme family protein [Rhodobacteraceae bacterium RKSG542]|uniref:mandelate racemase/muconate lactonizing enzyme family protein n=1 Tax=Pseudovibrio flavus TaxID=2529854 RepID=UPI0012BB604A|nr:mandelate racemase/muconate lactonizing enzyme family protein [Pseudovibrio flavus]MTI18143.1 mandelate racemase/muconate lactonizing enzyme family protein [Pseudovibrio flavus]